MPVTVERLEGEPILIATLTGYVDYEDIKNVYIFSNELINDEDKKIYRITDTRTADSSFSEMIKSIQRATQELPGSATDKRIQVVFVGTTSWIQFYRNALQKRGIEIAAFLEMERALEAVRLMIANDKVFADISEENGSVDKTG